MYLYGALIDLGLHPSLKCSIYYVYATGSLHYTGYLINKISIATGTNCYSTASSENNGEGEKFSDIFVPAMEIHKTERMLQRKSYSSYRDSNSSITRRHNNFSCGRFAHKVAKLAMVCVLSASARYNHFSLVRSISVKSAI